MMKKIAALLAACLMLLCASAGAEVAVGSHGYTLSYDPLMFTLETSDGIDVFRWIDQVEDAPACFLAVSRITDYNADEALEGLALQSGFDGEYSTVLMNGVETPTFYFAEGSRWDSRVCEYACYTLADGSVLLFESNCFLEAEEGIGAYMRNMLTTLSLGDVPTVEYVQCELCSKWFETGNVFRNHVCTAGEGEGEGHYEPQFVQCEVCGQWFEEGNVFRNHICTPGATEGEGHYEPQSVQCEICGGWYLEGNEFRNHICTPADTEGEGHYEPQSVQCEICGGWYLEGNEFRNHICTPADTEGEGHYEPEFVQCEVCGGWFEAGNVFRNHICTGAE